MVEIFKTNIQEIDEANNLRKKLIEHFPSCQINFDLDDCDKILRVEGATFKDKQIIDILMTSGFVCEVLPD